ncbi:type II toxin-antitoxin system RelE/ParE family toxin [Martelella sp. AD-3]|mgnify:FL=1|uniref:type II toxin-antitoxin system RelE/ParE family toxin n=1 Tax=Martelella sp. AD-3 TaxID=686597 RepID=UPI000464D3A0|nr:type II toxin-antitoxin system RelE/ParE family toxin [Martelella sp. AD-3]AMM87436.1 addiction module antitoxin RelB [Martelella sp. AD-3]
MAELIKTATFDRWLSSLKDRTVAAKVAARLVRLSMGNPGDVEPVGSGISELRIHYGKGYRVYYMRRGELIIVLLCGGAKSTQKKDIKAAKMLADEWKD